MQQVHDLRTTELLDAQHARLQAIIEAIPAAVIVSDNRGAGRSHANRLGQEVLRAGRTGDANRAAQELPEEISRATRGEEVRDWELKLTLSDGRVHHFRGNAPPLHDDAGEVCGAVAALVDVTERIQAEQGWKEADRRKDEFLAMLAHELRNPLKPIKTALEIIHKGLSDERRRDWALQVIDRQLVQLTRIIDDLLELGRIANGKITLK